jgi:ribosomal protein S18 acetylase RimI-like enzyme
MRLALQPASPDQLEFCENLTRSNLSAYLAARGTRWDSGRYRASWAEFENLMILADDQVAGVLRLWADAAALEIRDLQVAPTCQRRGIGSWAVQQAKSVAADRGFGLVRLRVFEENPARALYSRLGFASEAIVGGKVNMTCALPPDNSSKPKPPRGPA